jgi:hypothetical protein
MTVTDTLARLNPYGLLGLEEGDAHVIRNAGGVVDDDAIRSLVGRSRRSPERRRAPMRFSCIGARGRLPAGA